MHFLLGVNPVADLAHFEVPRSAHGVRVARVAPHQIEVVRRGGDRNGPEPRRLSADVARHAAAGPRIVLAVAPDDVRRVPALDPCSFCFFIIRFSGGGGEFREIRYGRQAVC